MENYKRIFVIVMDSLGVGALPDVVDYGDKGTNTLRHISESVERFYISNLRALGLTDRIYYPARTSVLT